MTRIESTSSPRSQTARTKRSTSTAVLPVPAPADTKTSPAASTAARCCSFTRALPSLPLRRAGGTTQRKGEPPGSPEPPSPVQRSRARSRPLHPAHRPEIAPRRTLAALGVVHDVALADASAEQASRLARPVDGAPERLLLEIVVPRVALQRVGLGRPEQAARLPLARERAVQAAERLEPDEVAQHEHVERDLQAQLALDLACRVCVLSGLVVLHDPPRAEWILVDAVDLPGEREAVAEVEPSLKLGRRALAAEEHLEP